MNEEIEKKIKQLEKEMQLFVLKMDKKEMKDKINDNYELVLIAGIVIGLGIAAIAFFIYTTGMC